MNIATLRFGQLTFIAVLLVFLCCSNAALAKSRFVPTPDDSNSTDSTPAQKTSVIEQATHHFEQAMGRWSQGFYGALLYYHRTDGPLSDEFQKIINLDPDLPRIPVSRNIKCITCDAKGDCDAIVDIKFNTENSSKLRLYHLRRADNWGLYSEARLQASPGLRSALSSCKRGRRAVSFNDFIMEKDAVRLAFERTMRTYRAEKWSDLLPLLATVPQQYIREQLAKPGGEQELLKTGQLPANWEFNCAVHTPLDFYYVYAWQATRNQNGQMTSFRFKFTADPIFSRWQLAEGTPFLNGDHYIVSRGCKPMREGRKLVKK